MRMMSPLGLFWCLCRNSQPYNVEVLFKTECAPDPGHLGDSDPGGPGVPVGCACGYRTAAMSRWGTLGLAVRWSHL